MTIPWRKLAAWAIEQAAKWGVGKVTAQAKPKKAPRPRKPATH